MISFWLDWELSLLNYYQTNVVPFFKPIAYALILLRAQGHPCVFYGDLYGLQDGQISSKAPPCQRILPVLMRARKLYAYGEQRDYFNKRNCIGESNASLLSYGL